MFSMLAKLSDCVLSDGHSTSTNLKPPLKVYFSCTNKEHIPSFQKDNPLSRTITFTKSNKLIRSDSEFLVLFMYFLNKFIT